MADGKRVPARTARARLAARPAARRGADSRHQAHHVPPREHCGHRRCHQRRRNRLSRLRFSLPTPSSAEDMPPCMHERSRDDRSGSMISRRDFARAAGWTAVATSLASCASTPALAAPPGSHTSFASLKQVDAGALNVGYAEDGPRRRSAGDPAARLAVRHPQLRRRGAGAGRARDTECSSRISAATGPPGSCRRTPCRNGAAGGAGAGRRRVHGRAEDSSARLLGGFDWGARTADIVAALWPERVQGAGVGERLPDRQSRRQSTAA